MPYTQLVENDTALCLQKMWLLASIKPHVFTNLTWDNIDRIEETLSGKWTSHPVNEIAVHPGVFGPDPPLKTYHSLTKGSRGLWAQSINPNLTYMSLTLVWYHILLKPRMTMLVEPTKLREMQNRKTCCGTLLSEYQKVPSWTGFNIQTRHQVQVTADVIEYLPTINAPVTE